MYFQLNWFKLVQIGLNRMPIIDPCMGEDLLTPSEVAERLRVNREVVYKWLQSGKMKGIRVGRHWRIRSSDLDAFLQ